MIAYGAPGSYVYQSVPAGSAQPCTTATFGGDPLFGTLKSCYVAPAGGPQGYQQCATEGGTCTVHSTRTIAYGLNGAFAHRPATGSIPCTNAEFGDALPLVVQGCSIAP